MSPNTAPFSPQRKASGQSLLGHQARTSSQEAHNPCWKGREGDRKSRSRGPSTDPELCSHLSGRHHPSGHHHGCYSSARLTTGGSTAEFPSPWGRGPFLPSLRGRGPSLLESRPLYPTGPTQSTLEGCLTTVHWGMQTAGPSGGRSRWRGQSTHRVPAGGDPGDSQDTTTSMSMTLCELLL